MAELSALFTADGHKIEKSVQVPLATLTFMPWAYSAAAGTNVFPSPVAQARCGQMEAIIITAIIAEYVNHNPFSSDNKNAILVQYQWCYQNNTNAVSQPPYFCARYISDF